MTKSEEGVQAGRAVADCSPDIELMIVRRIEHATSRVAEAMSAWETVPGWSAIHRQGSEATYKPCRQMIDSVVQNRHALIALQGNVVDQMNRLNQIVADNSQHPLTPALQQASTALKALADKTECLIDLVAGLNGRSEDVGMSPP